MNGALPNPACPLWSFINGDCSYLSNPPAVFCWTMNTIQFAISQVVLSFGLFSITVLPAHALDTVKSTQQGNVRAELSYQKSEESYPGYSNVRLKVTRAGQTVFNQAPKISEYDRPVIDYSGTSDYSESGFIVRDLDGDKEPEIITDFYTGGAHCCTYSLIYRYNAAKKTYAAIKHEWGDLNYKIQDLDKNGTVEFKSANPAFAYAFSSFAGSAFPVQIWRYTQGKMIDETRRHPEDIYADAYQKWQFYTEVKKQDSEVKGVLAAYMADKYLLNQQEDGWKRLQSVYQASDRQQFFTDLRRFLAKAGYGK